VINEYTVRIDMLHELKSLGVGLAIDDFGTGYSSLSYLKHLPVDFLKIDRSFINGLNQGPIDEKIVSAIFGLSEALGLKVIAEGVETSNQLAQLREQGCELAQGYYDRTPFVVPLTMRAFVRILAAQLPSPRTLPG
jgi:EAL domain-containing protein (putative c-di-GMP-specific phosphodiesterase class I)